MSDATGQIVAHHSDDVTVLFREVADLRARLSAAQAKSDELEQALANERTALNAVGRKLDEALKQAAYHTHLEEAALRAEAAAQTEVLELRRVLISAEHPHSLACLEEPCACGLAALSAPSSAQPLLDAVRLAIEALFNFLEAAPCGCALCIHHGPTLERALIALERWAK